MKKKYTFIFIVIIAVFYFGCAKDKDVEEVEEGKEIPIANFKGSPRNGPAPLTVQFTDQSSHIPTVWLWTLGDNSTSIVKNPTRTYTKEGVYSITLTVSNKIGSDSKFITDYIVVTASNTEPNASFSISPNVGTVYTTFVFNASSCSDDYDELEDLLVRWDFDGNGSWDTEWETDKSRNHQYSSGSNYNAKLEVKDSEGLTGQYIKNLLVNANTNPNAFFFVNLSEGPITSTFSFDASGSTDDDMQNELQVRWDFDGDGNWDTDWKIEKNHEHQYSIVGVYSAKLEVKDSEGLTDQYIKNIQVNANSNPNAFFVVNSSEGLVNSTISFNASGSTDDDMQNDLQVRWDFDGDGIWDTDWKIDKNHEYQYNIGGVFSAKLEVKDSGGLTDQYTRIITIHCGCDGETSFTYEGQSYEIVQVGYDCWMAENFNYETPNSWWYDNNSVYGSDYGRLYTFEAALDACPQGWHLPSDEEWKDLETELGMSQYETNEENWRGTDEGEKLKSTSGWNSGGNGINSINFTGLPGGYLGVSGNFYHIGDKGFWWSSSSVSESKAWYRHIKSNENRVYRNDFKKTFGLSVRLVKD